MKHKLNSGQALVLVLFAMAVTMTVVLSVVSRSISDVSITTKEEEALRAFSAAEAGIEEVLVSNLSEGEQQTRIVSGEGTSAAAQYQAAVVGLADGAREYLYPFEIRSGDTATIWFFSHETGGVGFNGPQLDLCWGKMEGTSHIPAVEVSLWYTDSETSKIVSAQALYDPAPNAGERSHTARRGDSSSPCIINSENGEQKLKYSVRINFQTDFGLSPSERLNGMKLLKARMLYNFQEPQVLGVKTLGGSLPSQGLTIESTGSAGEATRRVRVYHLYSDSPSIFDSAILSTGSIVK